MRIEFQLGAEAGWLEQDELFLAAVPRGGEQSVELGGMHADVFIFPKGKCLLGKGIDHKAVFELGSPSLELPLMNQMVREVFVQLEKTLLIPRQSDVLLLHAIAEVDPDHGVDTSLLRGTDKRKNSGSAVDVREGEGVESFAFRLSDQRFHRHRPVFEAEVRMAVDEHF